jgi:hypothetical protein
MAAERLGWLRLGGRVLHSVSPMNCAVCGRSDQEISLYKCPICFKHICDDCSTRAFGRVFCSKMCSDQFFFGDDDE